MLRLGQTAQRETNGKSDMRGGGARCGGRSQEARPTGEVGVPAVDVLREADGAGLVGGDPPPVSRTEGLSFAALRNPSKE